MAVAQEKASERVVVLLRPMEKRRLERLARREKVSAAEILRRSLMAYSNEDEAEEKRLIAEMNAALDQTLARIRSTRENIRKTLDASKKRSSKAA
ncbi:MAG TPA: hypothetical protein VLI45_04570 [Acidobacteriaceae bacterium]|nr:hypothetical protein [Acidobacteriaceae bacterium]